MYRETEDSVCSKTLSVDYSGEILYENIQKLRLCSEKGRPPSDTDSSASSSEHSRRSLTNNGINKLTSSLSVFSKSSSPSTFRKLPPTVAKKPKFYSRDEYGCNLSKSRVLDRSDTCVLTSPLLKESVDDSEINFVKVKLSSSSWKDDNSTISVFSKNGTRDGARDLDMSSRVSYEDDLPLGATFANFQASVSDSGCALESVTGRDSTAVSTLSVVGLGQELRKVGLMKETVETLSREKVDGHLLVSLDEEELKETLPMVKKLEIKKILMFINGWRPAE